MNLFFWENNSELQSGGCRGRTIRNALEEEIHSINWGGIAPQIVPYTWKFTNQLSSKAIIAGYLKRIKWHQRRGRFGKSIYIANVMHKGIFRNGIFLSIKTKVGNHVRFSPEGSDKAKQKIYTSRLSMYISWKARITPIQIFLILMNYPMCVHLLRWNIFFWRLVLNKVFRRKKGMLSSREMDNHWTQHYQIFEAPYAHGRK
jgi:hypothetical protein